MLDEPIYRRLLHESQIVFSLASLCRPPPLHHIHRPIAAAQAGEVGQLGEVAAEGGEALGDG